MDPNQPEPAPQATPEPPPAEPPPPAPTGTPPAGPTPAPAARPGKLRRLAPVLGLLAVLLIAAVAFWPDNRIPVTRTSVPHPTGDSALATELVTMHRKECPQVGPETERLRAADIPEGAEWCVECAPGTDH